MTSTVEMTAACVECNDLTVVMQQTHVRAALLEVPGGSWATFVAIQETGTISAAASRLHLSQPAVSRRLQGLERLLGAPLFDRLSNGLALTGAGRALLPHARRALAAEADAVRSVADEETRAVGPVEIGAVGSLVEPYLTSVLAGMVARHPDVDVAITTATSTQVCDLVRRGHLTVGLSYARPDDGDLDVETLAHERLAVVASPEHPAAGQRLTPSHYGDHRWLVFPDRGADPVTSGTIARRTLERHHVPATHLRSIDSLTAQRTLATAGYGLALLPTSMVSDDITARRLAVVEAPALDITVPVTMVTRRHAHQGRAAQVLLERLRATATA
jgi:DNA-binding transcriptional LysR family regulator